MSLAPPCLEAAGGPGELAWPLGRMYPPLVIENFPLPLRFPPGGEILPTRFSPSSCPKLGLNLPRSSQAFQCIDRIFWIPPPLLDCTARWLSNVGGCCKSCRWGTLRLIGGRMEMRECEKWEEGEAWREECWTGFSDRQSNWTEPKVRSEKCRLFPCPKTGPNPSSARRMETMVGGPCGWYSRNVGVVWLSTPSPF